MTSASPPSEPTDEPVADRGDDGAGDDGSSKPGKQPKKKRSLPVRLVRGIVRLIVTLVIVVFVLVGVILVLLQTDWGRAQALGLVIRYVNTQIHGYIEADELDGNVIDDLTLRGVRIKDPEGALVATADEVYIDHALFELLTGNFKFYEIRVLEPDFQLFDHNNEIGIVRAFEPTSPPPPNEPPAQLDLEALEIIDGVLRIDPTESSLALIDLDGTVGLDLDNDRIVWSEGDVMATLVNAPLDNLDGRVHLRSSGAYDPQGLELDSLELVNDVLDLAAHGEVTSFEPLELDLTIDHLTGNLQRVGALPPGTTSDLPLKGQATVSGRVHGTVSALQFDLVVDAGTAGQLTLAGQADIEDPANPGEFEVDATLTNGNPAALVDDLPLISQDLRGVELTARVTGAGNPAEDTGHAEARIDLLAAEGNPTLADLAPLRIDATKAVGGAARVVIDTVGTREPGRAAVHVEASVPRLDLPTRADASWRLDDVDLTALAALPGLDSLAGLRGYLRHTNGQARIQLDASGALTDLDTNARLSARGLVVPETVAAALDRPARVGDIVANADLRWPGQGLPRGDIDLVASQVDVPFLSATGVAFDGKLDPRPGGVHVAGTVRLDAATVAAGASPVRIGHASGPLDVTVNDDGTIPRASIDLVVSDFSTGETQLASGDLDVAFSLGANGEIVARGPLSIEGFRQGPDISVARASGVLDLERRASGALTATLDRLDARDIRAAGQRIGAITGPVAIDIDANGRIEAHADATVRDLDVEGQSVASVSGPIDVVVSADGTIEAKLDVTATDIRFNQLRVGRVSGPVTVSRLASGAASGSGTIQASDIEVDGQRVGELSGSGDVQIGADGSIEADADITARDVRSGDTSVGELSGSGDVKVGADGSIDADADVTARDVRSGNTSVGEVSGPVDVQVGADGSIDADADIEARDVRSGDARIGQLDGPVDVQVGADGSVAADGDVSARDLEIAGQRAASADIDATVRIVDGRIQTRGNLVAREVRASGDVQADDIRAEFDVEIVGDEPTGRIVAEASGTRVGQRNFGVVRATADLDGSGVAHIVAEARSGVSRLAAELDLVLPLGGRQLEARIAQIVLEGETEGIRLAPGSKLTITGDGTIVAENARIEATGGLEGYLLLDGTFAPADGRYDIELEARDIQLQAWTRTIKNVTGLDLPLPGDLDGRVDLVARLEGAPGERPEGKLTLRLRDARGLIVLRGIDIDLDVYLDEDELFLTTSTTWGDGGRLALDLELPASVIQLDPLGIDLHHDTPFELEGSFAGVDLDALQDVLAAPPSGAPIDGDIYGDIYVDGTLGAPRGALEARIDDFDLGPQEGVVGGLDLFIEPGQMLAHARFVRGTNGAPPPIARALPEAAPGGTPAEDRDALQSQTRDLLPPRDDDDDFQSVANEVPPEAVRRRSTPILDVPDEELLLALDGRLPFNPVTLIVEPEPRELIADRLEAEGVYLDIRIPGLTVDELPYTETLPLWMQDARFSMDARLSGRPSNPDMDVAVRAVLPSLLVDGQQVLMMLDVSDEPLSPNQPAAVTPDDLFARLVVDSPNGSMLSGSMRMPEAMDVIFEGQSPMSVLEDDRFWTEVTAQLNEEDLRRLLGPSWNGLFAAIPQPMFGARLELTGGTNGPSGRLLAGLDSQAPLSSAALEVADPLAEQLAPSVVFAHQLRVTAEFDPDRMSAVALLSRFDDTSDPLRVEASLEAGSRAILFEGGPPSSAGVSASITSSGYDLTGLDRLLPDVFGPSPGKLVANASITGTFGDPDVSGEVAALFDTLRISLLGLEEDDVDMRFAFTEQGIELVPIALGDEDERFELWASLGVPSLDPKEMPLEGNLKLRNYGLLARPDVRARVSGELDLGGTLGGPRGEGSFVVDSARIEPARLARPLAPTELPPETVIFVNGLSLASIERAQALQLEADALAAATTGAVLDEDEARFVINLVIPRGNVWVTHPLFDVSIWTEDELEILTRGAVPAITGVVRMEGTVNLYGRAFELSEESQIAFRGVPGVDPSLQITATYDISNVDLTALGLNAEADSQIFVEVSGTLNDPELELRSDPPMDQTNIASIVAFGSPVGAAEDDTSALQSQTANLFVGILSGQLSGLVEGDLPIDIFGISGEGRVTVGKRISERLTVVYQASPGATEYENVNEILAKLRIAEWLTFETRFGDAGRGGAELLFRKRW